MSSIYEIMPRRVGFKSQTLAATVLRPTYNILSESVKCFIM